MSTGFARRLKDAAVFLLVTMLLLAAVETAARFLVLGESRGALRLLQGHDPVSRTLAFIDLNLTPIDKDVDYLWRNRASVEKRQPVNPQRFDRHDEWTIVNNARGFRSVGPIPSEKLPGEFRILCIGDSVTFGFNVDQADSYPERLQVALRARYPGRPITVINAGTSGWSWLQGVRLLEREGIALRPDLVIMAHGTNDRFFPAQITDAERFGDLGSAGVRRVESLRLLLERTATYRLVERWFAPRTDGPEGLTPACLKQIAETRKCNRVGLDEIDASIATANRLATLAGAALLVLNLDFQQTDAITAVRNAVRREHVPFVDVVSEYLNRRAADEGARERRLGLAPTRLQPAAAWRKPGPARALFRVLVPPGGSSVRVEGATLVGPTTFRTVLNDDGNDGDEIASDGVWSGRAEGIDPNEGPLLYAFLRDGVPELIGLWPLPSTQGRRKREVVGDALLPVDVFGELYLMTESTHPNAEGHELIAQSVLGILPNLQPFARWSSLHDTRSAERHRMGDS